MEVDLPIKYDINKVGDRRRLLLHRGVGGATPFAGMLHFTLDPYLIIRSIKQGRIKYHFLSL